MSIKRLTPHARYRVLVDFADGERNYLVNAYTRPEVANHTAALLIRSPFIMSSWVEDRHYPNLS